MAFNRKTDWDKTDLTPNFAIELQRIEDGIQEAIDNGAGSIDTSKFVTTNTAQTLTGNKTFKGEFRLNNGSNEGTINFGSNGAVHVSGANSGELTLASQSDMNFITLGPFVINMSAGTSGQVLTSQGNASPPKWTTISSGTTYTGTSPIVVSGSKISHSETSGNKHIPSGGSSGQFLEYKADGEAKWSDTTISGTWSPNYSGGGTVTLGTGNYAQTGKLVVARFSFLPFGSDFDFSGTFSLPILGDTLIFGQVHSFAGDGPTALRNLSGSTVQIQNPSSLRADGASYQMFLVYVAR